MWSTHEINRIANRSGHNGVLYQGRTSRRLVHKGRSQGIYPPEAPEGQVSTQTPADMHDTQGAHRLLAGLKYVVPRLKKIGADAAYRGKELADWCKAQGDWDLEVVERTPGVCGFNVLPTRWVVERTFGWISRNRRMSTEYERMVQTSEALIEVVMCRLLVVRLARSTWYDSHTL